MRHDSALKKHSNDVKKVFHCKHLRCGLVSSSLSHWIIKSSNLFLNKCNYICYLYFTCNLLSTVSCWNTQYGSTIAPLLFKLQGLLLRVTTTLWRLLAHTPHFWNTFSQSALGVGGWGGCIWACGESWIIYWKVELSDSGGSLQDEQDSEWEKKNQVYEWGEAQLSGGNPGCVWIDKIKWEVREEREK